jgi:hypothetical protein
MSKMGNNPARQIWRAKRILFRQRFSYTAQKNEDRSVSTLCGEHVSDNPASRSFTAES